MSTLPLLCYTQQSLIQHFLLKKQLVKPNSVIYDLMTDLG